jgi:hypothetical protein
MVGYDMGKFQKVVTKQCRKQRAPSPLSQARPGMTRNNRSYSERGFDPAKIR